MNPTALRNMVAGWLTDTCTIADDGVPVFDPSDGTYAGDPGDDVYDGACRVRPAAAGSIVEAGDAARTVGLYDVTLPWDTTSVRIGHVVTITGSADPYLVDRKLRVVDVQGGADTAYRRLVCVNTLTEIDREEGGS